MPFTISVIDHVQITVAPEQEALAKRFYGEILGLREIDKPEELKARGGAWFQLGNAQLHVAVDPGASGASSRRHVCLLVDDLDATRSDLLARGITIKEEPIQADGLERFFIRDPADNRVEIGKRR